MSNPNVNKRQKERARQERQRAKEDERKRRRQERSERVPTSEDPDIAGIVPGPQPTPQE